MPKHCFPVSGKPLEPSGRGTLFLCPTRAPLKPPLEPQRLPQSTQGTHMSSQGLHQTCKVSMLETLEISLFGSQDLKKTISSHFFTLRKLSRDPTKWAPIFCWSSRGAQNAPRELPGTPKDHPEPPDDPLGPLRNVKNLPRTYQVPSRALLTSPKGPPMPKNDLKGPKYVVVLPPGAQQPHTNKLCNTFGCFEKYVDVLPPP